MAWRDTVGSVVGSVCCVYAGLPFDVVKVRMQTGGSDGPLATAAELAKGEPWTTFWRGALPALTSALVENAVLFTVNGALQRNLAPGGDTSRLSPPQQALIGGLSAFASSTAITPSEVVKVRLQAAQMALPPSGGKGAPAGATGSQGSAQQLARIAIEANPPGPFAMARHIMKSDGPLGFYKGLPAAMSRDVPFYVFYFGAYHTYTSAAMRWADVERRADLPVLHCFLGGGIAGSSAWAAMFPLDVIKSRWQAGLLPRHVNDPVSAAGHIAREHGWRALYRGWSAAVVRGFPANGALFLGLELAHRMLGHFVPTTASVAAAAP